MNISNSGRTWLPLLLGVLCLSGAVIIAMDRLIDEHSIPTGTVEASDTLENHYTTEEAITHIRSGAAILEMALDTFKGEPTSDLGSTVLAIADEFDIILGGLCTVPGTEDQCALAKVLIVDAYETLIAYVKTLEENSE